MRAAAAYAEGLVTADVPCLRHAAAQLTDPWLRSSATEGQGVLLARSGDEDKAARVFDEALRGYASVGAGRDVARMRRRLRKLGIRRRHSTSARCSASSASRHGSS